MAEGRMLKKRIANSEKLGRLKSDKARVLYFMMLPHLDVEGRLEANPRIIKGQMTTMLSYSTKTIQCALEALSAVGLLTLYNENGNQYAEYTRFEDFQSLNPSREAKSTIPPPTPDNSGGSQRTPLKLSKDKLSKDKYKELVFLTADEYQKLIDKFGEGQTQIWIDDLDIYMGKTGRKYKSHYLTILSWDRKKNPPKVKPTEAEIAATKKKEFEAKKNKIRAGCGNFLKNKSIEELRRLKNDPHWKHKQWLIDEYIKKGSEG